MKVAKFGGTSLADADQVRKVIKIVRSDWERRCVVVSAPGKRNPTDTKITELLYSLVRSREQKVQRAIGVRIASRYQGIIDELGLKIDFRQWFGDAIKASRGMSDEKRENYMASKGEYWMAVIMAEILGYAFIDAKLFVALDKNGLLDIRQTEKMAKKIALKTIIQKRGIVVPGFYGVMSDGGIKTFSRGGSDITGAIVASCVRSSLYENWTDVSGIFITDPRIVENHNVIEELTYRELRELAYMGASVLHDESIFPIRECGIPINVRNTDCPEDKGTMIVSKIDQRKRTPGSIVGIAGRKGFSVVRIEKTMMDNEIGFLRDVCDIFARHSINIEHIPGGIDTLSVIVEDLIFNAKRNLVLVELNKYCKPDAISIEKNMAMVCVVGSMMAKTPGFAARIFKAVASAGINVRMINQGSSEISIIIGVNEKDYETTIHVIYNEFV